MKPFPPENRKSLRGRLAVGLIVLAALAGVPATASAAATPAWQMTITGRGYGHGIGMCQYGAYGYALHGYGYKAILQHYYTGIGFGTTANRDVRVLLTGGQKSISLTCAAAYEAVVGSQTLRLEAGATATVTWTGSAYQLAAGKSTWTASQPVVFQPETTSRLLILVNRSGIYNAANAPYRGSVTVADQPTGLCAINTLPLESYLRGVVPCEMPSSWAAEALKAQAVAARTYAVRSLVAGGLFDLYSDTRSQSYGGAGCETAATDAAIAGTAGVIATYGGQPIAAFYFSTSGGQTENIENVWPTSPQPYLKSVADPYDTLSPYHIWPTPIVRSGLSVAASLGAANLPVGQLQALYVVKRGVSPRVVQALALSDTGATVVSGSAIRAALGLRDTWFYVRAMSISPGTNTSMAAGQRMTLSGTTYPALPSGTAMKLYWSRGGAWSSVAVPSGSVSNGTRTVQAQGVRYTCSFTTYHYTVKPAATTTYYFAVDAAKSPQVTLSLGGTPSPTPSPTVTPAGVPYSTQALRSFRITRGRLAVLRYRISATGAARGTRALVTVRVRSSGGTGVKTVVLKMVPLNVTKTASFRCYLKRGTYRYYVYARFPGAGRQTAVGTNRFVVL
jgi:stage II sporulation protein D